MLNRSHCVNNYLSTIKYAIRCILFDASFTISVGEKKRKKCPICHTGAYHRGPEAMHSSPHYLSQLP